MDQGVIQANRWKFFTVGGIGTLMATLDGSILNVALPTITEKLHTDVSVVAWIVLAYSLTLISLMMVFGAWTEHRGYFFSYRFGYAFFLFGSVLCSFSNSIYFLIFARVVQAIGTAMFAAIGPGLVAQVFPAQDRGKGIGMMVMMVAGGFMLGPPVGGLLLSVFSWRAIFLVNIPIGIAGIYLVHKYFRMLPAHVSTKPIPFRSAVAISTSLVTGVFALTLTHDYPLSDPRIWGLALVAIIAFALWVKFESNPKTALIGLDIFRTNRLFTFSLLAQSAYFVGTSGIFVLIPFYLENVRGFEPKQVGFFLVILPILMFVLSPLAGKLSDRIGFQWLTTSGMFVSALGLLFMAGLEPTSSTSFIVASLAIIGCGIGLFSTPNSSAMMGSVTERQRAVASGILATNRNIGMSLGVALATSLFSYLQKVNVSLGDPNAVFVASYRPVIYVGMTICLVGSVFCFARGERKPA